MISVEQEVAALDQLTPAELKARWVKVTGTVVPKVSPALLRLALAWELQAQRYGGHARETTRKLDQLARGLTRTPPASPGMRLVREWQGQVHVVLVGEDGIVRWEEREYRSLSEVARAITGTRWSGPAFFGTKRKVAA